MDIIILDRDGVINHDSDEYIKSPAEWLPIPGSLEAIARLSQAGFRVVIATNQSGLARGLFDVETLGEIHAKMERHVAALGGEVEAVFFCPHGPWESCPCRKPKPGLFLDIARRLGVHLDSIPAVGDSVRDIQAARAAGAQPVLVLTGNGLATLEDGTDLDRVPVYNDLAHFADAVLSGTF